MALPLFKATILAVRNYSDNNGSTKVIVRPTAMTVDGDIVDLDLPENRAVDAKPVCFRLRGENALDKLAAQLTSEWGERGFLKANQHIQFKPGSSIYFQGLGPGEWNGESTYKDEELLTMLRVIYSSISGSPTTKIRRVMTAGHAAVVTPEAAPQSAAEASWETVEA